MHRNFGSLSSRTEIACLFTGSAIALLAYVLLLATFSTSVFPQNMVSAAHWPALMDKPVGEDGYYMLTVADNIARTGHILYNYGVPATGIQPLATMLYAGLDVLVRWFGGGASALIRSVLALGVVLHLLFATQISRITYKLAPIKIRREAAVLAFVVTLSCYTLFRLFTYGLETGVYLLVIAVLFQVTLRIAQQQNTRVSDMLLLGVTAGVGGEARIDFGLVFLVILGFLLVYRWISFVKAVSAGVLALGIVAPWFRFVHQVSGSWLPTSGKAESTLISWGTLPARFGVMLLAVAGNTMPWCYGVASHVSAIIAVLSGLAVIAYLAASRKPRQLLRGLMFSAHSKMWLASMGALLIVYLLLFNATHFYYRYLAPLSVMMLPVCVIVLARAEWVRRHIATVAVTMWAIFACWSIAALHVGRVSSSQTIAAGYIHTYFPNAHVGAFQSGVVGFYNRNVENLDGKLNQGALEAAANHQLTSFIDHEHIDVLIDWSSILHTMLPSSYLNDEWESCPVPIPGGGESICLIRKRSNLSKTGIVQQPLLAQSAELSQQTLNASRANRF